MVPVHQLVSIIGAGGAECRRRCIGRFGAGEEKWWGPAPAQCTEPRFAAQVPPQKSHLRQECCPPAPEKVLTCADKAADLFHSGSSSCCFVLLMLLALSTNDAVRHSRLDRESSPLPFQPSPAPCHFDRAEKSARSSANLPGVSPNCRTGGAFLRAVPRVAVRHRPKSALGAR